MKQGTIAFFVSAIIFSTGTSVIGYALAQNFTPTRANINANVLGGGGALPWYCVPETNGTTPGYTTPGYTVPGYGTPGYNTPPKTTPGYTVPGYVAPGYKQPGYVASNYATAFAFNNGATYYKANWKTLLSCPKNYKMQPDLVQLRCNKVLQNKLNGLKFPADSVEQFNNCKSIIEPSVWNAKITSKSCAAFAAFNKDCAKKNGQRCGSTAPYLTKAGVSNADMKQAQVDVVKYCKNVFPQ